MISIVFLIYVVGITAKDARVIRGKLASISQYPFAVAVLNCNETQEAEECETICTGSLISPDVVLTAGHCLVEPTSTPGETQPLTPLENMRILVGSAEVGAEGKLYAVKSYKNRGVWQTPEFPLDNDVGLIFLSETVELIPGKVEVIKISPDVADESCGTEIAFLGFGQSSNLEKVFGTDTDTPMRLRVGNTRILPASTCRSEDSEFSERIMTKAREIAVSAHHNYIHDSLFFCTAGDSEACYMDSGGPAIATLSDGTFAVIGVVSFGSVSSNGFFCGGGPDYFQRMSWQAFWIAKQLEENSIRAPQNSFTRWPVEKPVMPQDYLASRCPNGCTNARLSRNNRTKPLRNPRDLEEFTPECLISISHATDIIQAFRRLNDVDERSFDMLPITKACERLEHCDTPPPAPNIDLDNICARVQEYKGFARDLTNFERKLEEENKRVCSIDQKIDIYSLGLMLITALLVLTLVVF